jgi:hypothetical protein
MKSSLKLVVLGWILYLEGCGQFRRRIINTGDNAADFLALNSTHNIPLIEQQPDCEGKKVGLYTWGQHHWKSDNSLFIAHLTGSNARRFTCGDVYINVADYSSASKIDGKEMLLPFIINVRRAGNSGVVWMTYGDVVQRDAAASLTFVDTFYDWLLSVPSEWLAVIKPIGLSYDIEQFTGDAIQQTLLHAQKRKTELSPILGPDGFRIQCTVEGQLKPVETDIVMKYADSALMMVYRNYVTSPSDPTGARNGIMKTMRFMLTEQCSRCLDDSYASLHYKAKITIMVETSCKMGKSCSYASFCAMDGGVAYLASQLDEVDKQLVSSGLMTVAQKARLISTSSPFAIHDWDWFQCYYGDHQDTNPLCKSYDALSQACRKY